MKRAIALIDGEHYPNVVRDALEELSGRYRLDAAVLMGGTEKIGGALADAQNNEYGVPVMYDPDPLEAFSAALRRHRPQVVVDLSDEPVLGYRQRFHYASYALAAGAEYQGADFTFLPPSFHKLSAKPSVSVIGTGKRIGKTAVSGFLAREATRAFSRLGKKEKVVVVAMGRGGPPEPELISGDRERVGAAQLLSLSRQGKHAASDYLEDAALSSVTTIGCRRCGGGMAGMPFVSNVVEGARLAETLPASLVIFEGSGSALPPVQADRVLCVAGANQREDYLLGYFGAYRMLISDAVVLTMCEEPLAGRDKIDRIVAGINGINPGAEVVPVVLRPKPAGDIGGARVAYFSTAPAEIAGRIAVYIAETYDCSVDFVSGELAKRDRLRAALSGLKQDAVDVFLTEIKAAAVDVVAEEADRRGTRLVFCDNVPVETGAGGRLAPLMAEMAGQALAEFGGSDG